MARYSIILDHESQTFSASHLIVFNETENNSIRFNAEPFHGHDFRVAVRLHGPLNPDGIVLDFITAKNTLLDILKKWEHKILLPQRHASFSFMENDDNIDVEFQTGDGCHKRWSFPYEDTVLLDVENATTEVLASLLCDYYCDELMKKQLLTFPNEEYEIEFRLCEGPGTSATIFRSL